MNQFRVTITLDFNDGGDDKPVIVYSDQTPEGLQVRPKNPRLKI